MFLNQTVPDEDMVTIREGTPFKPDVLVVTDPHDPFDRTLDIWLVNRRREESLPFTVRLFPAQHPPRGVMEAELCAHLMDYQYDLVAAPYHLRLDATIQAQHLGKRVYYGPGHDHDRGIDTTYLSVHYRTIPDGFFEEIGKRLS